MADGRLRSVVTLLIRVFEVQNSFTPRMGAVRCVAVPQDAARHAFTPNAFSLRRRTVPRGAASGVNEPFSASGVVSTGLADIPSLYLTSHSGQLSLLSSAGLEISAGQGAVLCEMEGNRRSGVALPMSHRLRQYVHLRAKWSKVMPIHSSIRSKYISE